MARHTLIYRGWHQHRLAHKIVARQPLLSRMARQRPLVQALGLTTATTPRNISTPVGARFIAPPVLLGSDESASNEIRGAINRAPTDYPFEPQQVDQLLNVQSRGLTAVEQALAE